MKFRWHVLWPYLAGAALGLVILIATATSGEPEPEENTIPIAPPGYQYCVDKSGERLMFCEKEG